MNTGTAEEDFVSVFRLGKRDDLTRLLLIQLAGYSCKNLIMESLYKLKHAETKFQKIIIAHDMTKTERAECKRLVAEAKSLADNDSSGEYIYRVRGFYDFYGMWCDRCIATKVIAHDEPSVAAAGTGDSWLAACDSKGQHCSQSANASVPDDVNDLAMKHFAWISHAAPQFAVDGTNVHILSEPSDYYETLKVCSGLTS